jgi:hypothetical protein
MTRFVCPARKDVRALFGVDLPNNIVNSSYFKISLMQALKHQMVPIFGYFVYFEFETASASASVS